MDEERLLIEALVVERHRGTYLQNAEFHAAVNMLARLLPPMIDGLALAAGARRAAMQDRLTALMRLSLSPFEGELPG